MDMEESDRELMHKAIKDMIQWIKDSPTEEVRQYRIGLVMDTVNGKMKPQWNVEWGTAEELKRNESDTQH
jgi:hypothetical protein